MKKMMVMGAALFAALSAFAGVKETDWAKIETPDFWTPDTPLEVKITLKGNVPAGQQVCSHLQWMKKAGWGGFLSWVPGKPAESGKTYVFKHKPKMKDGLDRVNCLCFLAPDGDFKKKTKSDNIGVPLPGGKLPGEKPASSKPDTVTFKKSYIWLEEPPKPTKAGDELTLKIHYKLDPSDTWGDKPTQLQCMPLGPWIDNPDGTVNKNRHHVGYPGLGTQKKAVEPGDHVIAFTWKLQKTFRYNGCFFRLKFVTPEGKEWPWEWRGGGMDVVKGNDKIYLEPLAKGGLFKYGETPKVKVLWGPKAKAGAKEATLTVRNVAGEAVLTKTVTVDPSRKEESVAIPGLTVRGTFSVTLDVPGVGSEYCYFGTIPTFERKAGKRTPFGVTNIYDEDFAEIAGELGFSFTRLFTSWKELQPSPKEWKLDGLDKTIAMNDRNGLKPWICLYNPPAWALPEGMWSAGFEPSPFSLKAWGAAVEKLARQYDGKLMGFEMLNEIVPGNKCKDPVKEYVDICRVGHEAAKKVNPKNVIQLAGGLWPHNYRIDLLNAGVGQWIDVLPVHYSTYEGIVEAKTDLKVRGLKKVRVADNETASGLSTWQMDPAMTLAKSVGQCKHVMTRWPDELCAGSLFVTYFGGSGDPCGNWSYMIDRVTPRPCAVTLAVVQGKIGYAKPVGKFFIDGCPVQLFENDGKAIAFIAAPGKEGVKVTLPGKNLLVTDYQGNETRVANGVVTAGDMPVIVEGLDLPAMKLHAVARVGTSELPAAEPQVVVDAGEKMSVPVLVRNPYAEAKAFTLTPSGTDRGAAASVTVKLAPGEEKGVELVYAPKAGAKVPPVSKLAVSVATPGIPAVAKPFLLYAIDPASIGNLLKNGDFEKGSESWGGKNAIVDAPDGTGKALCLAGSGKGRYKSQWQGVEIPVPGQSYLYTCWMRGEGMGGGSNIGEQFSDGTKAKQYYMPAVFSMGANGSAGWRLMVKRFDTKPNTKSLTLTPVAEGNGKVYYDNVSLSLYKGTDFAAFAGQANGAQAASKVPLCCDNQVKATGGYAWTPANLSGVGEFTWDAKALRLKVEVTDDVSAPKAIVSSTSATGEEALKGDMLALAIFPKTGADGLPTGEQLRWYMNLASPGGGSGTTTLFRPAKYAMGLKSGQLAKDSSVYQVNFRRQGGKTIYDVTIPWSEIPGFAPAKGAIFGCNLVLIDADSGSGLGKMVWGADLGDTASGCGVVTLLP